MYQKPSFSDVRFGNKNTNSLLWNKKLHLVLDLDHTLLNSAYFDELSPDEDYLKTQTQVDHSLQHLHIVDIGRKTMTKLRPFIMTFLWQASQMFEISIYTMGDREYALEMAKLLDPSNQIFGGRVISRSDGTSTERKSLDVLLARQSNVIILDDTKPVWVNENQENVIVMPRYHFFRFSLQHFGITNSLSLSESKRDEFDRYGGACLAGVLHLLRDIYTIFFSNIDEPSDVIERDVRLVMQIPKKQVLNGCKIVFSGVFSSKIKAEDHALWKIVFSAICSIEADESVTHVVSADTRTQKSYWAVSEGKFLVNHQWIHTANLTFQKPLEEAFHYIS